MQVPGSMYTRRRLRRTVLRRWRLLTAIVSALALVAGLLVFYAVHAGEGPAPAADPGSPVAVHVVHGRKVPIPPMRAFRRAAAVWPTAQTATVIVTGATVRAGSTPVYVGPGQPDSLNAAAAVSTLSRVQVSLASHQTASALGVHGVVFGLTAAPGSPAGRVHVSVDYSSFAEAYGGGFASRLHLVVLPACALTTPQLASCREQTPVRAAASDNLRDQRIGADVALPGLATTAAPVGTAVLLADMSSPGVVLAANASPSGW